MQKIKTYYEAKPLQVILLVAFFLRLLAAFFSKGYAFHDDHFDVIRVAQNWVYGLPHWIESDVPPKHSMVYAALNAVLLWVAENLGISDTVSKTTFLRLFHAVYSLWVVYYAYKITALLAAKDVAQKVAWIIAVLWFMPFLSVKFLAEMTCVPPVLAGFYSIIKDPARRLNYFFSGALFAIAFSVRMHTILFAGGLGLVLLFEKKWLDSVIFTLGYLLIACLLIGIPDILFFDYPFHYVVNYFAFNSENAYNFITGSPFKFLFTTLGFLVPPVSVMLVWGYIKSWRVEPKLWLAVLIFFIAHSAFPNKQERFILPMYPLLIMLGTVGWSKLVIASAFWNKHRKLEKAFWTFFWTINLVVGLALALTYSKKDRVAPIHYLSSKEDVRSVIVESEWNKIRQIPVYYLGRMAADYSDFQKGDILGMNKMKAKKQYLSNDFPFVFLLPADKSVEMLKEEMHSVDKVPNYVVFKGKTGLDERKKRILTAFPGKTLSFEAEIGPSNLDRLLTLLNPRRHRDETAYIYRINDLVRQ